MKTEVGENEEACLSSYLSSESINHNHRKVLVWRIFKKHTLVTIMTISNVRIRWHWRAALLTCLFGFHLIHAIYFQVAFTIAGFMKMASLLKISKTTAILVDVTEARYPAHLRNAALEVIVHRSIFLGNVAQDMTTARLRVSKKYNIKDYNITLLFII